MLPLPLPRGGEGKGRGGERRAAPRGAPHNLASSGSLPEEEEEGEEEEEEEGKEGEGRGGKIKKKKLEKVDPTQPGAANVRSGAAERSRGCLRHSPSSAPGGGSRSWGPSPGSPPGLEPKGEPPLGWYQPPWVLSAPLGVISPTPPVPACLLRRRPRRPPAPLC